MSSFIISKIEFIKAAGLMCGYEEGKRDPHKYFIDNVRKEFEHAYALNVASVNEQYGDNEEPEEDNYDEVFEAYRKTGALIRNDGYKMGIICYESSGRYGQARVSQSYVPFLQQCALSDRERCRPPCRVRVVLYLPDQAL